MSDNPVIEGEPKKEESGLEGSKILGGFFVYRARPSLESKRIGELMPETANTIEGVASVITKGGGGGGGGGGTSDFDQQGEITGMVLVKQSGDRQFMSYVSIDPTTNVVDKFMEYFKDTIFNNAYDNDIQKVFDIEALSTLVNKLILQPMKSDNIYEETTEQKNSV